MRQRVRNQIGTAGLVIAIIALVAALAGGAFAAAQSAHQSKKAKPTRGPKGPKGATGATGAPGAAGLAGAAGPAGPIGPQGPVGPKGTTGTTGTAGATGPAGPSCDEETGECNLPSGATESGVWSSVVETNGAKNEEILIPISFPLHLTFGTWTLKFAPNADAGDCPGTVEAPTAKAGILCLYPAIGSKGLGMLPNRVSGTDLKSGAVVNFLVNGGASQWGYGSWAITAP
jgi:Collagen triple helix repeat (20 copies)